MSRTGVRGVLGAGLAAATLGALLVSAGAVDAQEDTAEAFPLGIFLDRPDDPTQLGEDPRFGMLTPVEGGQVERSPFSTEPIDAANSVDGRPRPRVSATSLVIAQVELEATDDLWAQFRPWVSQVDAAYVPGGTGTPVEAALETGVTIWSARLDADITDTAICAGRELDTVVTYYDPAVPRYQAAADLPGDYLAGANRVVGSATYDCELSVVLLEYDGVTVQNRTAPVAYFAQVDEDAGATNVVLVVPSSIVQGETETRWVLFEAPTGVAFTPDNTRYIAMPDTAAEPTTPADAAAQFDRADLVELDALLAQQPVPAQPDGGSGTPTPTVPAETGSDDSFPLGLILAAAAAVIVAGVGLVLWRRRRRRAQVAATAPAPPPLEAPLLPGPPLAAQPLAPAPPPPVPIPPPAAPRMPAPMPQPPPPAVELPRRTARPAIPEEPAALVPPPGVEPGALVPPPAAMEPAAPEPDVVEPTAPEPDVVEPAAPEPDVVISLGAPLERSHAAAFTRYRRSYEALVAAGVPLGGLLPATDDAGETIVTVGRVGIAGMPFGIEWLLAPTAEVAEATVARPAAALAELATVPVGWSADAPIDDAAADRADRAALRRPWEALATELGGDAPGDPRIRRELLRLANKLLLAERGQVALLAGDDLEAIARFETDPDRADGLTAAWSRSPGCAPEPLLTRSQIDVLIRLADLRPKAVKADGAEPAPLAGRLNYAVPDGPVVSAWLRAPATGDGAALVDVPLVAPAADEVVLLPRRASRRGSRVPTTDVGVLAHGLDRTRILALAVPPAIARLSTHGDVLTAIERAVGGDETLAIVTGPLAPGTGLVPDRLCLLRPGGTWAAGGEDAVDAIRVSGLRPGEYAVYGNRPTHGVATARLLDALESMGGAEDQPQAFELTLGPSVAITGWPVVPAADDLEPAPAPLGVPHTIDEATTALCTELLRSADAGRPPPDPTLLARFCELVATRPALFSWLATAAVIEDASIGLLYPPAALAWLRAAATGDRDRTTRSSLVPADIRLDARDRGPRLDQGWAPLNGTDGPALFGMALPNGALQLLHTTQPIESMLAAKPGRRSRHRADASHASQLAALGEALIAVEAAVERLADDIEPESAAGLTGLREALRELRLDRNGDVRPPEQLFHPAVALRLAAVWLRCQELLAQSGVSLAPLPPLGARSDVGASAR